MTPEDQHTLKDLALESVEYALRSPGLKQLEVVDSDYPESLQQTGACFVTLMLNGQLRGCIGTLEANQSLVRDVAHNAYNAAFRDPRFEPLSKDELPQLEIHISVLNPAEAMQFASEQDLLQQLTPGVDGLILDADGRRATFLPSVWEQLPDKAQFLQHLKVKAHLPPDYWSDSVKVYRYTTESF